MAQPELLTVAAFAGRHLAALLLLAASAYALGRWLSWDLAWQGPLERLAVCSALGLAAWGTLGFLLGLAGQLAAGPLIATLAAVHLLAWRVWRELASDLRSLARSIPPRRLGLAAAGLVLALAPFFLLALYPPTAFDATLYHLPFARAFARTGRLPWLPALRFPVFPQLSEVLFAEMMLLAGEVAAHLVELLAVLLTALLLLAWGRAAGSAAAGWIAAAAYLGNPLIAYLGGTAYIEPGLSLFATASLFALWRWRREGGRGWLALAAALAAAAASTKYLGFVCVGIGGLAVLAGRRQPARATAGDLGIYALVALAALAPWYGRILFYTGNPVFPFLPGVFGASPWQPQRGSGVLGAYPGEALARWGGSLGERLGTVLARFASIPWNWTFRRDAMGSQPPVSPAYLAAMPLLAWAAVRRCSVRRLLLLVLLWAALFLALPADSRYLLPALALLSLALGLALDPLATLLPRISGPGRRRLLAGAALALFLPGWLYAGYRMARLGPPPATAAARERYLAANLPLYPAVRHLNRACGRRCRVYGLFAENMKYYVEGEMLGDWNGPATFSEMAPLVGDPARLHRRLRGLGVDHLLIRLLPPRVGGVDLPDSPAARRLFRLEYGDGRARVYAVR